MNIKIKIPSIPEVTTSQTEELFSLLKLIAGLQAKQIGWDALAYTLITLAVIDTLFAIKCGISEIIQLIKSKAK
jgi:hypothetical protein